MLIKGLREDEYVVQIHETHVIGQARHHQFHNACELAGSIEMPLPFSRDNSSLVAVTLIDLRLPEFDIGQP